MNTSSIVIQAYSPKCSIITGESFHMELLLCGYYYTTMTNFRMLIIRAIFFPPFEYTLESCLVLVNKHGRKRTLEDVSKASLSSWQQFRDFECRQLSWMTFSFSGALRGHSFYHLSQLTLYCLLSTVNNILLR